MTTSAVKVALPTATYKKLMQKEIKLKCARSRLRPRFLVIWFANANSLPFDAYGFNLCVFFFYYFQSPFISHGHRYHYTNTQLCKCGEMEMIVSLLWFDLSGYFFLLEKHIQEQYSHPNGDTTHRKEIRGPFAHCFFAHSNDEFQIHSFIHSLHMLIRDQEFFVSFYSSYSQQSNKNHFTPLEIPLERI